MSDENRQLVFSRDLDRVVRFERSVSLMLRNPTAPTRLDVIIDASGSAIAVANACLPPWTVDLAADIKRSPEAYANVFLGIYIFAERVHAIHEGLAIEWSPITALPDVGTQTKLGTCLSEHFEMWHRSGEAALKRGRGFEKSLMFVASDGWANNEPAGAAAVAAERLRRADQAGELDVFPVAMGEQVNWDFMRSLAQRAPVPMRPGGMADFLGFVTQVSRSLPRSLREKVSMPSVRAWSTMP